MQPTSTLCRAQEALQLERAASSPLDSVRVQAGLAAAAWGKEAVAAEHRERRKLLVRDTTPETRERGFSENPDRGYSDVALAC